MFSFLKANRGYKNVPATEFNQLIASNPDAVIIDVRTPAEVQERSIPKAVNINSQAPDFAQKMAQLDKAGTYLVYCRSGARSGNACSMMAASGFTSVYNLSGGLMSYRF